MLVKEPLRERNTVADRLRLLHSNRAVAVVVPPAGNRPRIYRVRLYDVHEHEIH